MRRRDKVNAMPKLIASRAAEELRSQARATNIDLSFYIEELQELQADGKVEGTWELLKGETPRAEKRRFTMAAKQLGLVTAWKKASGREIKLVLAPEGEPLPGSRAWQESDASSRGGKFQAGHVARQGSVCTGDGVPEHMFLYWDKNSCRRYAMAAEYRVPASVIDEAGALHGRTEVRLWRHAADAADPLEQVQWGGISGSSLPACSRGRERALKARSGWKTQDPRCRDGWQGLGLTVRAAVVDVEGLGRPPF